MESVAHLSPKGRGFGATYLDVFVERAVVVQVERAHVGAHGRLDSDADELRGGHSVEHAERQRLSRLLRELGQAQPTVVGAVQLHEVLQLLAQPLQTHERVVTRLGRTLRSPSNVHVSAGRF